MRFFIFFLLVSTWACADDATTPVYVEGPYTLSTDYEQKPEETNDYPSYDLGHGVSITGSLFADDDDDDLVEEHDFGITSGLKVSF